MQRRNFLTLAPAALGAFAAPAKAQPIASIEFVRLSGRYETLAGVDRQHNLQMTYIYDDLRPKPYSDAPNPRKRMANVSALYLRIKTAEGVEGLYGPIRNGRSCRSTTSAASLSMGP